MTFQLLDTIAQGLYGAFGGALFLPLVIIAVISLIILSLRMGKVVFFLILVPMITTMGVYGLSQNFQGFGPDTVWIPVAGWMALGVIVSIMFFRMIR